MKKIIPILIIITLLISSLAGTAAAATISVRVFVDGTEVQFPDQKPLINSESRTLVPVRFVSQALGAEVGWDGPSQQVSVKQTSKNIFLSIGQKKARVNESEVILDTAACLVNSRTMVPLRFVSECLGARVEWDGANQAVYIYKAGYVKDEDLVDSDLIVQTPAPGDNPYDVNLTATIDYRWNVPIEPQIADLQEILEKRFSSYEVKPVIDYIRTKKVGDGSRLAVKDWTINGKLVRVGDGIILMTVQIWNKEGRV